MRSRSRPSGPASDHPATLILGLPADEVVVEPGAWTTLTLADPQEYGQRCAGGANHVPVALDGDALPAAAHLRARAGLGVVLGRLPDLPLLNVLDVVLLGVRDEQPPLWQTMLGKAGVRALREDQAAAARALAGRTGLAPWVDRPAVGLAPNVGALADLTRAVAGAPRALIWCRPVWLDEQEQQELAAAVAGEQTIRGFGVLELMSTADDPTSAAAEATQPSTLPGP